MTPGKYASQYNVEDILLTFDCFLVQKCEEEEGVVGGGDEEEGKYDLSNLKPLLSLLTNVNYIRSWPR